MDTWITWIHGYMDTWIIPLLLIMFVKIDKEYINI